MIKKYKRRPLFVEATEFTGWGDVEDIRKWAKSGNVLYVPAGAVHGHRNTSEVNWDSGNIAGEAPEFLMVETPDGERRADIGDFILLADDGGVYVVDSETFNNVYEPDGETPFSKLTPTTAPVPAAKTMVAAK